MSRGSILSFLIAGGLLAWAVPATAANSVGVARFEASGAGEPPEVATPLADRLLTAGVETIGPDQLGVPAVAEPEPRQVMSWAEGSGVDVLVFGRVTGIGGRYSVDVQLRSAASGEVMSVHVTEIARPGAVGEAVDELARKVMQGLDAAPGAPQRTARPAAPRAPAEAGPSTSIPSPMAKREPAKREPMPQQVSTSPPRERRASGSSSSSSDDDGGLFGGSAPVRITSDTLEARQSDGARHMIFQRNVRATRDDLVLTSDRLDAFYPKGSSRPQRLVATGRVVMKRDDGEAHCSKMTYIDAEQMIHCEGDAELTRDGDVATGDKIEWDLETDTVFIKGNADVLLTDAGGEGGS